MPKLFSDCVFLSSSSMTSTGYTYSEWHIKRIFCFKHVCCVSNGDIGLNMDPWQTTARNCGVSVCVCLVYSNTLTDTRQSGHQEYTRCAGDVLILQCTTHIFHSLSRHYQYLQTWSMRCGMCVVESHHSICICLKWILNVSQKTC